MTEVTDRQLTIFRAICLTCLNLLAHLVAAVTVEIDKESKLMPIFIPMMKKDAVSGLAA